MKQPNPIVLIVVDGYGLYANPEKNPIANASKPVIDGLIKNYPYASLNAAEQYVGLSFGEMGNSEVGHLNIGAGKVIYQSLPRISVAIADKSFFKNEKFLKAVDHCRKNDSTLHLVGMVSNGGVHAHLEHLHALLYVCKEQKFTNVKVHAITDGRDTAPAVGLSFLTTLTEVMKTAKLGAIATVGGRYYAMDRNNVWDRTKKMYDAMVKGEGEKARDPLALLKESYKKKVTDEMIIPTVIVDKKDQPIGLVKAGDSVIFFNFRPDRARQLAQAFVLPEMKSFDRGEKIKDLQFTTMMEYEKGLPVDVAFAPELITMPLARVISEQGWKQYHIAETEKYAHVTYFLNGGQEEAFKGEERDLVPSPAVATYDEKPEMSAAGVTDKLVAKIKEGGYALYVVNYANPDMVAHTGNYAATVQAVEAVDTAIGRVVEAALAKQGKVLITADHGNAEVVVNEVTGEIDKEHSTNPVPLFFIDAALKSEKTEDELFAAQNMINPIGLLADVAPTILDLYGIKQPAEMTGKSLVPYLALVKQVV
ncbi:MAG: 2,3-bisphosphoglycerate-independent phosphoglycerate mutase [bacterium]|nr:2,3-bisphosphoglycerate-independent phosphoglycerate mutase [bacterium]